MQIITKGGEIPIPIMCWASTIESGAIDQAINLANLSVNKHHVALMPDAHQGFGMPIGGVVFTDGAIIPNAVGVDIGCGVALLQTGLLVSQIPNLQEALDKIAEKVPTGFNKLEKALSDKKALEAIGMDLPKSVDKSWWERALSSLGTLGGGNHFIEFQSTTSTPGISENNGEVFVMLHSGSRGLGKMIGDYYHRLAVTYCKEQNLRLPTEDLAFFPLGTVEHALYQTAMEFGMAYAQANREIMLTRVKEVITDLWPNAKYFLSTRVNVHHNFAAWEKHFGTRGIVHRKGAIRAQQGELLLIPGSMGTSSYIAEGLGNPDSFNTCQHGAGRAMGRKEANRQYAEGTLENLATFMGARNILMGGHASEATDEHPKAYKDIEQVMLDSADLVKPLHRMTPLGVIKG